MRPDRQKHLFLILTSVIMIFVRDVKRHYQIAQVHKKIIRDCIFSSSSDSSVFWFCWMTKFKCQSLGINSGKSVSLFTLENLLKKTTRLVSCV